MALSVNGGGYGNGTRRRGGASTLSEINVTPFVDVVLVLLIIFMLTAHVMESGVEVDVPVTKSVKESNEDLPIVAVTKDGTTWLNGQPANMNDLKTTIDKQFNKPKAVFLKADKEVSWEIPAQVMAELGLGGYQVRVVTTPMDSSSRKGR